jgi:hypothetical protein
MTAAVEGALPVREISTLDAILDDYSAIPPNAGLVAELYAKWPDAGFHKKFH